MAVRLGTLDQINVAISPRGGGTPLVVFRSLPMDGAAIDIVENDTSTGRMLAPINGLIAPDGVRLNAGVLTEVSSWSHEVKVIAGNTVALEGPIVDAKHQGAGMRIEAADFTAWWQKRPVGSIDATGDVVDVVDAVHGSAIEPDPSPNFGVQTYPSGLQVTRRYDAADYRMAGDVIRELARTGANFVARGRTVHVRGPVPAIPSFTLEDRHILGEPITHKAGRTQANRVYVTGKNGAVGFAEDTASIDRDGLLVRHFTETTIADASLDAAAASRLAQLSNPIHLILPASAQISPDAPVSFAELLPGNIGRVTIAVSSRPISATFRIAKLSLGFDGSVRVTFSPVNEEIIL